MNRSASAPLRLHGYPVSNYHNIVRAALIEKNALFDIVATRAQQDPQFLRASPMGKIPYLQTEHGCIAETVAILEYLEDTLPQPPMLPTDCFQRARARQIVNVVQMYVEAASRALFPGVFLGLDNPDATVAATRGTLDRATAALSALMRPAPFLSGTDIGYADIFAFYCLDIADRVSRFVYARSIVQEIGTLGAWCALMADRQSTRAVSADFYPAFARYLADHKAAYDWRSDQDALVPSAPRARSETLGA